MDNFPLTIICLTYLRAGAVSSRCAAIKDLPEAIYYLRQGGYVFVCIYRSVCLLAKQLKRLLPDLAQIFRIALQKFKGQLIEFWG